VTEPATSGGGPTQVLLDLLGDWAGTGWACAGAGAGRAPLEQTETVRRHLDGSLLTVEGQGSAAGRVVHRAFAVISCDDQHRGWRWTAYVPGGRTDTDLELYGNGFGWTLHDDSAGQTRFRAVVTGKQWRETGHRRQPDGTWTPVFAMDLRRLGSTLRS